MASIVRLNVGGVHYSTTRGTLLGSITTGSYFTGLFSGAFQPLLDADGCYFIDRNGTIFGIILDFIRSHRLSLPADFNQFDLLAMEADFYQVQPLILAVKIEQQKTRGHLLEIIEVKSDVPRNMPATFRNRTVISGRRDSILTLPVEYIGPKNVAARLNSAKCQEEYIQLELEENCHVRSRLGNYLQSIGCTMKNSSLSSSACCHEEDMCMEHSYRDQWFCPGGLVLQRSNALPYRS